MKMNGNLPLHLAYYYYFVLFFFFNFIGKVKTFIAFHPNKNSRRMWVIVTFLRRDRKMVLLSNSKQCFRVVAIKIKKAFKIEVP
jgi:hypothetical protein